MAHFYDFWNFSDVGHVPATKGESQFDIKSLPGLTFWRCRFLTCLLATLCSHLFRFWAAFGKSFGMLFGVPGNPKNQAKVCDCCQFHTSEPSRLGVCFRLRPQDVVFADLFDLGCFCKLPGGKNEPSRVESRNALFEQFM